MPKRSVDTEKANEHGTPVNGIFASAVRTVREVANSSGDPDQERAQRILARRKHDRREEHHRRRRNGYERRNGIMGYFVFWLPPRT